MTTLSRDEKQKLADVRFHSFSSSLHYGTVACRIVGWAMLGNIVHLFRRTVHVERLVTLLPATGFPVDDDAK